MRIASITQFKMAAEKILALRCHAVLIKGGHLEGNLKQDNLYMKNAGGEMSVYSFHAVSVVAHNTHGTGCTLSSAISSFLAIDDASLLESEKMDEQEKLVNAISKAKEYVTEALKCGQDVEIGKGTGPLNHFFAPCPMRKVEKL
jgi:hydroxymethylpyrimidine/phosphomethylpyrimidine kinase